MILVTGGTGIVGSHLLLLLSKKKQPIVATYRDDTKIAPISAFFKLHKAEESFKNIEWKKADITDVFTMEKIFNGIEYVYHCAAFVSFEVHHRNKLTKINTEGTANIVNLSIKNKVKKIAYVSSVSALGEENSDNIITENNPWNNEKNHSYYAYSKYGAELEIWRGTQEGLPAVIINPGLILTPFFWDQSSGEFFRKIEKALPFYPIGQTGFVTAEDVAFTLNALMESSIENERYILVAENITYKNIFGKIATAIQGKKPKLPLKKSLLFVIYFLDKIISFLGIRKSFMSLPLIDSMCSQRIFDGSKITRHLPFKYQNISESVDKIGAAYLTKIL